MKQKTKKAVIYAIALAFIVTVVAGASLNKQVSAKDQVDYTIQVQVYNTGFGNVTQFAPAMATSNANINSSINSSFGVNSTELTFFVESKKS